MTQLDSGPLTGQMLDEFQIMERIGKGAMSEVYRAFDTRLRVFRAVKVLAPHLAWDDDFVRRFELEAQHAAALEHPNIVRIYRVGESNGVRYIAMQLCAGESLHEVLRTRGRMSPADVVPILNQLGQALDFAHERGYIHRDVKPGNVMLGPDGSVTLLDFGLVRALEGTQLVTSHGVTMGTIPYMSPEQIRGTEPTKATDVYSLGHTVYEMLSGRPAFQGSTERLLYAQVHEMPPAIPGLTPAVQNVLTKALDKDPTRRFPTAGGFATAFQAAVKGVAALPPPPKRRIPVWLIVGLIVPLLAIAGIVMSAGGQPQSTPTPTMTATTESTDTPAPSDMAEPTTAPSATMIPSVTPVPPPAATNTRKPPPPRKDTPTIPPPPNTPTVPPPAIVFDVWCDPRSCKLDDDTTCGAFNWQVVGAREVYLVDAGGGTSPQGGVGRINNVCLQPGDKAQFTVRVLWMDGRSEEKSQTLRRED